MKIDARSMRSCSRETGAHSDKRFAGSNHTLFLRKEGGVRVRNAWRGWIVGDLLACVEGRKRIEIQDGYGVLMVEVVTHPWREAGCCMKPIGRV